MRIKSFITLLALPMLAAAFIASAQNASPVGRWKTYDEETGKPRLIVEVYEAKGGTLAAKVVDTLFAPNAKFDSFPGADKGKPKKDMGHRLDPKPRGAQAGAGWLAAERVRIRTRRPHARPLRPVGRVVAAGRAAGLLPRRDGQRRDAVGLFRPAAAALVPAGGGVMRELPGASRWEPWVCWRVCGRH